MASSKHAWDVECLELAADTNSLAEVEPPPSYIDCLSDNPPPYTFNDSLLDVPRSKITLRSSFTFIDPASTTWKESLPSMTTPRLDFGDSSNFRQAAKKKKGGQKQTSTTPEDEGSKEPGGGEDNGGGGGAGAGGGSNNGDGGAGGDGGDGWDNNGDDWNTGKKKKGKKNRGGVTEDEEKKKKQEQEEEEEKERVRKEDEEETADAGDPLSWANGDADPNDEWAGFMATGKKAKKNKKGKVRRNGITAWHAHNSIDNRLIRSTPLSLRLTHQTQALMIILILMTLPS